MADLQALIDKWFFLNVKIFEIDIYKIIPRNITPIFIGAIRV